MERRAAFIQALRDCADFLESHPEVTTPNYVNMNAFVNTREELAAHAKLGAWEKVYLANWFSLERAFGADLRLAITVERAVVCRKVVTGTRVVPAQPEQTVEEFEWHCDEPLLAPPEPVEA